jgi:hypothetical protein
MTKTIADRIYDVLQKDGGMSVEQIHTAINRGRSTHDPDFLEYPQISGNVVSMLRRKTNPVYRKFGQVTGSKREVWIYSIDDPEAGTDRIAQVEPKSPTVIPGLGVNDTFARALVAECHSDTDHIAKTPEPVDQSKPLTDAIQAVGVQIAQMIAVSVIENLTPMIKTQVADLINNLVPKAPIAPIEAKTKPRLRHILVLGLLGDQQNEIKKEFEKDFHISFWHTGENTQLLKSRAAHSECVFIHTKHMGHFAEETLKSMKSKVIRVPGGISAMKDAITKFYCEE